MVGAAIVSGKSTRNYDAKITSWVLLASLTAASGGFLFGYDIGITALLKELYTGVPENSYCKYDNQNLALFTSFLYAGGLLGTWGASRTTRAFRILVGSSLLFSLGLNTYYNLPMFIFGRFLLGVAVGLGNQAVPIYLSDIAPAEFRGLVNMFFQLFTSTGGSLVNYGFRTRSYMELILPGVPTAFMVLGVCLFGETPNGLIERGLLEKGKATLQKIRGTMNVEEEYEDLVKASDTAKAVKDSDKHPLAEEQAAAGDGLLSSGIPAPDRDQLPLLCT